MLGFIDKNLKPPEIKLQLAKPSREIIGNLNHIYGKEYIPRIGRINEVSFTMPYEIIDMLNMESAHNKMIDRVLDRYLIKGTYKDKEEWFIINEIKDSMDDKKDVKEVHAYGLGYELQDKTVRNYKVTALNLPQVVEDVFSDTTSIWSIGKIPHEFYIKYRSFDVAEQSLLEFLYEVGETYGALIEFDTVNRKINFHHVEDVGQNKGLTLSYGKYLKRVSKTSSPDEMVTRLFVYGKDNLSINRINPAGSPYLEDFTYFMYPFERDENRNVLKKSKYMTPSLCHALLDYQELIESKKGVFANLIEQKESLQEDLTARRTEMSNLRTEMLIIEDRLDMAKAGGNDLTGLNQEKNAKQNEINNKQTEINSVESSINNIDTQITNLQNEISIENNFTPEQIAERDQYIIMRTWSDPNYINDRELYIDAQRRFIELKQPKTTFELDMVDFLQVLEESKNWDKLVVGDEINIKYERIGVNIKAKITEIKFNYDSRSISLSIANVTDLHGDATNLLKLLQRSATTSKTLELNKYRYDEAVEETDRVADILNSAWASAKRRITAGVNESITISERGLLARNPDFENEMLVLQSGVLALSRSGGNTWETAVTPYGIIAERLMGKAIIGENLTIGDDEGTFNIQGNLLTIKDRQDIVRLLLGEYDNNKFGLKLMNRTGQNVILDENGILQSWQNGRTDNVDPSNGLSLYIYLPESTLSVRQAILSFKLLAFRSYAESTASGGATTRTSSSGGGTTVTSSSGGGSNQTSSSGGGANTSTASGGGKTDTTGFTNPTFYIYSSTRLPMNASDATFENHFHAVQVNDRLNHSHTVSIPSHTHGFSLSSHTHDVTIPNHSHSVTVPNHTHDISIPNHTHDMQHGIYTSTTATGISVIINGTDRTSALGGKFNSDQNNLNITSYMRTGQWNEIRLTTDRLGRIDANIFIQAFVST